MSSQRVVLVTGASSGVGRSTARLLSQKGYKVFGTSRNPTGAEATPGVEMLALDVRTPGERERKFVAGSVSIPLNHLPERLQELPADRPLLVYCAGGYRSSIAASLLQQKGFTQVSELAGGLAAWETAHLPTEPT